MTYIVQRVESLMGLFLLLTLYCAIRAAEPGRRSPWWAAASVLSCAIGMGAKETMVTAPLLVVLWDYLLGRGQNAGPERGSWWRVRWPLYAGLASTWVVLAVLVAGSPRSGSAGFGLGDWTWWSYLRTQAGVVVHYLRLAAVPSPLVFDYDWPRAESWVSVAPHALLLVGLLALTALAVVRRHPAGFAGAWWFLILAPTSSILPIPTEVAAEHRMYLPVAAVVALAVLAIYRFVRSRQPARTLPLAVGLVVGLAVAAAFGTMTRARNVDYTSTERLMRDTVDKAPHNIRSRVAYGAELLAARRFSEAESELGEAVRLEGSDKAHAQANMYLGAALCAQGRVSEGVARLQQALRLDSSLAEARATLGEAYAGQGASPRRRRSSRWPSGFCPTTCRCSAGRPGCWPPRPTMTFATAPARSRMPSAPSRSPLAATSWRSRP